MQKIVLSVVLGATSTSAFDYVSPTGCPSNNERRRWLDDYRELDLQYYCNGDSALTHFIPNLDIWWMPWS